MEITGNLVHVERARKTPAWATNILLSITIVYFLIETSIVFATHAYSSVFDWLWLGDVQAQTILIAMGALTFPLSWGQAWRLITYMFLHYGIIHMALNALGFSYGANVEKHYGWKLFLLLYFAAGFAGGLCITLFPLSHPPLLVGASGALYGFMMVDTVHDLGALKKADDPRVFKRTLTKTIIIALLWMLFGNFFDHLGGALAGVAFAILLKANVRERLQWLGAAKIHIKKQQYEQAVKSYEQAIHADPEYAHLAPAYIGKGEALLGLKRYQDALDAFTQARRCDARLTSTYVGAGEALRELRRYGDSLEACGQALRLDPKLAPAYVGKGSALMMFKRNEEALVACEQALRLDPRLAPAYVGKGSALLNLKRYEEGLTAFEQALRYDPKLALAYVGKGETLLGLKRYQDALDAFTQARTCDARLASTYVSAGEALWELRRYEEALAACQQALRLDPNLLSTSSGRSSVLNKLRQTRGMRET